MSRPKLREALTLLKERGLICSGSAEGAEIARLTENALSPALIDLYLRHPKAIDDHLEFRRVQESLAARLAAVRATDEDRQALVSIVEEMVKANENKDRTPDLWDFVLIPIMDKIICLSVR